MPVWIKTKQYKKNPSIVKMSFYNNTCASPRLCNVFEKMTLQAQIQNIQLGI